MRAFILSLFISLGMTSFAQTPLSFTKVIEKEGADSLKLFELARNWLAHSYTDSKAVIQDAEPGKRITGHGVINFRTGLQYISIRGNINYIVDIQFKNERMRFEMKNFTHEPEQEAMFNNHMGVMFDPLPKDLKDIGVEGANRKASYKYFYKKGKPLCEQLFTKLSLDLEKFIEKGEIIKNDW